MRKETVREQWWWLRALIGEDHLVELLAHSERIGADDVDETYKVVRIAGLLRAGVQRPSVVAAFSTASSLEGTPAWHGLLALADSLEQFSQEHTLAPSIRSLVQEAVGATARQITRCVNDVPEKQLNAPERSGP